MPSTYQSKVQGAFIISVNCDRPYDLAPFKWFNSNIYLYIKRAIEKLLMKPWYYQVLSSLRRTELVEVSTELFIFVLNDPALGYLDLICRIPKFDMIIIHKLFERGWVLPLRNQLPVDSCKETMFLEFRDANSFLGIFLEKLNQDISEIMAHQSN